MPNQVLSKARELISAKRWSEALCFLQDAVNAYPNHPELLCELAYVLCSCGQEDDAISCFPLATQAPNGVKVLQVLLNHYYSRCVASKKFQITDDFALKMYRKLSTMCEELGYVPEKFLGINISACLIVKNEEQMLAGCLASLQDVVDEIIVVDTGSEDDTIAIAKEWGARVESFEWIDDFSAARNRSLELATGDWVLWIDADERLDPKSIGSIITGIVRPHFGGFNVLIENYVDEENKKSLAHKACRLFRLMPNVRFEGRIHEQITPSIERTGLPIAYLEDAKIFHYGYTKKVFEDKAKADRTIKMVSDELLQNPYDSFHWFNLGNAQFTAGDFDSAIVSLSNAVSSLEPNSSHGLFSYFLLASALAQMNKYNEAIETCTDARKNGFESMMLDYMQAAVLFDCSQYEEALEYTEKALANLEQDSEIIDTSIADYKALFLKGAILSNLNRSQDAIEIFKKILYSHPHLSDVKLAYANELKQIGEHKQAYEIAKELFEDSEFSIAGKLLAAECANKIEDIPNALKLYESAWKEQPDDPNLWQLWVSLAERWEDWETAVRAYSSAAEFFEPSAGFLINAGRALGNVGEYQMAMQCFEDAIKLDPQDTNAYLNAGDLLYHAEKYADAVLMYRAGISLGASSSDAWLMLGNSLAQIGALETAVRAYEQSLEINPNEEKAKENLQVVQEEIERIKKAA